MKAAVLPEPVTALAHRSSPLIDGVRDHRRLDRRRLGEPQLGHRLDQRPRELQLVEARRMRRLSTRRDGLVLFVVLGRRAAAAPCAAALLLLRLLLVGLPRLPLPSNLACLGLDQRFGSVSRLGGWLLLGQRVAQLVAQLVAQRVAQRAPLQLRVERVALGR